MENRPYPPKDLPHVSEDALEALTIRQREILQLVQDGQANKEIASRLGISEGTVKQHLVTIFRRLGVHNRTMAASMGMGPRQKSSTGPPSAAVFAEELSMAEGSMHYASAMQPVSLVVARLAAAETLMHRLGSADFGQLYRGLQRSCLEAAERFRGVMQGIPGGFLLLFGVPNVREDDPERAACCAFWVQRHMANHPVLAQLGEAVPVRLCVLSGEVLLSSDGGKTTLHGDILSHPCLMSTATCDNFLYPDISPATRQAVRHSGERYGMPSSFFPEGDAIWRILDPSTPAEQPVIPFVGRDGEMRELLDQAEATRKGGSRTLLIVGEAGFGKTRLVQELRTALTVDAEWLWLEGSCRTVAAQIPCYPLATVLERLSDCPADWSLSAKAEKMQAWMGREHALHWRTGRRLLALLSGETEGDTLLESEMAEVAKMLLAMLAATRRPTVLFLDNLQWADPGTLALFPHLARGCNGGHVWLIGTTRRAWLRAFPGEELFSTLSLGRLPPKSTLQLLKAVCPSSPGHDELLRQMAQWSSGVPLFATELGRQVAQLPAADSRSLLTLFPVSLQGLILERLDAVRVDWRVVRAIAAHGQLTLGQLLALGIHPRPATEAAVTHLLKIGLLGETGEGETRILSFNNEMVRAAVWLTLLAGDRRAAG
ncbi:MAG: AAA family ATPase [Magnetococcus sp. XQGC-1]